MSHLFLDTVNKKKTDRPPVWLMRQAGRILPEYRVVRTKMGSFKQLVKNPDFACEVTLQPVDILDVDVAIIFSDILVVPEAMGLTYEMIESKGPFFPKTIKNKQDIDDLRIANPHEHLDYVLKAIQLTKKELNNRVPLIGFAGAPWTIFAYMIEGSGSKTFSQAKKFLYTEPVLSHLLLQKITTTTIQYLQAQIVAGADLVQVFDSWAGILSPSQYATFAMPYMQQIADAITTVPLTLFAKGAFFALESFNATNCKIVGLDWNTSPELARQLVPNKVLQGNLDPCVLYGDKSTIKKETENMLQQFGATNYIANLGHGVYPDVNKDNVKYFIEIVKNFKPNNI